MLVGSLLCYSMLRARVCICAGIFLLVLGIFLLVLGATVGLDAEVCFDLRAFVHCRIGPRLLSC